MDLHCAGVYFDGASSKRRDVTVRLGSAVEIIEGADAIALWTYDDLRQLDAAPGALKVRASGAPDLASLTVSDPAAIDHIKARAGKLRFDGDRRPHGALRIVALSIAAAISIVVVTLYGVPKMARALADVMPLWAERKLGDAAAGQVKAIFGGETCSSPSGDAALAKLAAVLTTQARPRGELRMQVLRTRVPNAIALPGGQIYLFDGLLQRAEHVDEIAGVLGHEIGHQVNRDGLRGMIEAGGTAFLLGLLFGDVTGSSALILIVRQVIDSAHSREAETAADNYGRQLMHALGRPSAPMAKILMRLDPFAKGEKGHIFASHPATPERLRLLEAADANPPRPLDGPQLLTEGEWRALKAICAK
jgi:Zn-dependent protease with chaperone function